MFKLFAQHLNPR